METEINEMAEVLRKRLIEQKQQLNEVLSQSNIPEKGKEKILDMLKSAENGELKADFNVLLKKINDIVNATDTTHTK